MSLIVLVISDCQNRLPHTGWLKQQKFLSHSVGGWRSQREVPADLVSGEAPFPGLQKTASLQNAHLVESKRASSHVSSFKDTNAIGSGPHPYGLI